MLLVFFFRTGEQRSNPLIMFVIELKVEVEVEREIEKWEIMVCYMHF